jgi:HPt (histidine-containing phosphotransfer) domain-containing protein
MTNRDIAPIYSTLAADPDFAELVTEYVREIPDRVNCCVEFLKSQNWPELKRFAHQIKGSAASYGFEQITVIAGLLEAALARDTEFEQKLKMAEDLIANLSAIRS